MKTMNHSEVLLKLAEKFSRTPGPRYASEGNHSGEDFRNNVLHPAYESAVAEGNFLVVILDGTCGYGTSFLEEAFGGLIRENGIPLATLKQNMRIVSVEEPDLLEEVSEYMEEAESQRNKNG